MSSSASVRRTLLIVLACNAAVTAVKLSVGFRRDALTVIGAGLESALDLMNNVIALAIVSVAHRAPDEEHPYGHAKFETLGALAVVGFLSISCFELLRQGVLSLSRGETGIAASAGDLGFVVSTLVINAFVVSYESRRGRELGSPLLLADAAHTRSDILVTLLAIASLWLSRYGLPRVDGALAIIVAVVIAWTGWQILRASIPVLVDERAVEARQLRDAAASVAGVLEVRQVRSRTAGSNAFAEVTIAVSSAATVAEAHALADAVEAAVADRLRGANVTVHVEPM